MSNTLKCIRCDEEAAINGNETLADGFKMLTFDQEAGALPICVVCFDQVRGRNVW